MKSLSGSDPLICGRVRNLLIFVTFLAEPGHLGSPDLILDRKEMMKLQGGVDWVISS